MPGEYYSDEDYLYAFVSFQDADAATEETTVACAVRMGSPTEAEIFEYDDTFDFEEYTTLPFWERNYPSQKEDPDFSRNFAY